MGQPLKKYRITDHAYAQLSLRNIHPETIRRIMEAPEQILLAPFRRAVYQSRELVEDRMFLVRVVVEFEKAGAVVVTAYRTRSVAKYWRKR
jgi:hypothetical protein